MSLSSIAMAGETVTVDMMVLLANLDSVKARVHSSCMYYNNKAG